VRALTILLMSLGLLLGVGEAIVWHFTHWNYDTGWTLYSPLNDRPGNPWPRAGWWPTIVVFPISGLVLGALGSLVMSRLRWNLVRRPT